MLRENSNRNNLSKNLSDSKSKMNLGNINNSRISHIENSKIEKNINQSKLNEKQKIRKVFINKKETIYENVKKDGNFKINKLIFSI